MKDSTSIQRKLSRWLAIQTFIGLSLVCAAIYAVTSLSFELKQNDELSLHAENVRRLTHDLFQHDDLAPLAARLDDYFTSHQNMSVALWVGEREFYSAGKEPRPGSWVTHVGPVAKTLIDGKPLEMSMSLDVAADNVILRRLASTLIAAASLGTITVSLTGMLLVRRGLRPLSKLAKETGIAGPDHPGLRIESSGYAAELRPWIDQFNGLLARVEGAYLQLEAFNANVAHELRTPLSNMIAQAEIELGRDRTPAELKEALESQLEEARRLSGIVTDMLFLSRADRGVRARRGVPASLAEQVRAVADFREVMMEDAHLTLDVEGEAHLSMDAALVRRAVSNLMGNAIRHATPGTRLRVLIEREARVVRLSVENNGATIDAKDLPRLFERFFRGDEARVGSSTRHGLGLAIVAAIARMHGGNTFAASRNGVTCIGLTLLDERSAAACGLCGDEEESHRLPGA